MSKYKLLFLLFLLVSNLFSKDLKLSKEEKNYLLNNQTIKVHNEMNWPPFNFNEDGVPRGYSIDYMNLIAKKLGIKIDYIHGFTWGEFVEKLKKHEIDVMLNMVRTKEREKFVEFTHPYLNILSVIYTRPEDKASINSLIDLQGKTVAIPKGFYIEELFKKHYPSVKLLLMKNNLEGLESVAIGEADATVGELGVLGYLKKQNFISNVKVAAKIKDKRFLSILNIGVQNEKSKLRDLIQKAMDSISDDEIKTIENKWFGFTQTSKAKLSDEQKLFIRKNPTIKIHNEMNWPPFNFNDNGKAKGYSIDYMNLVASKVGLNIKYIHGFSWDEFVEQIKNHEIDVMLNIVKTKDREKFIDFTEQYIDAMVAIYTNKKNATKINSLEDLNGKTVAIPKGFYHQELLSKRYPKIKLLLTKSHLDSLEKIAIGKADATVGVMAVLDYLVNKNFISNVKIAAKVAKEKNFSSSMHIGIRDDKAVLTDIIQKGMDEITNEEIIELEQKWFGFTQKADIQLTKKEKEFVRNNPILKVHNELNWPPFNYNEDGKATGYSVDYMNKVASKVGFKIDYISGPSWGEFLDMLRNKELDVMLNIVKTQDRKKYINFTKPYLLASAAIYTNPNKKLKVRNVNDLNGKIVAIPKGFFYQEIFEKYYPNILLLLTKDHIESLENVAAGNADATLGEIGVINFLIKQYFIPNVKIAAPIKDKRFLSVMHFGTRDDKPLLRQILQKGIDSINEADEIELKQKWLEEDAIDNAVFRFTKEEKRYLKKKQNIKICIAPNRKPFEYIDSNSNHSGVAANILEIMRKKLGYEFKVIPTKSWHESLTFIEKGKCELLPLTMKTPVKEEKLTLTAPYLSSSLVIATKENANYIESLSDLRDKTIAVVRGYASNDIIKSEDIGVVEVSSIKDGLKLVKEGKVFGFVDSVHTIGAAIKENAYFDLKIGGNLNTELKWSMAVKKDNDILLNIINKTLFSIDKNIIKNLYTKNTSVKYVEVIDYWLITKISILAILIVLFLIYRNSVLKKHSKKIVSINKELEIVSTTDGLTKIYNRRKIELMLESEIEEIAHTNSDLSIILIDVDNFKKVNDTHGHEIGDRVLISIASLFKEHVRPTDMVGRWGGEEFLIICKNANVNSAYKLSTRLKNLIEETKFEVIGKCTASFGVVQFKKDYSKTKFVSSADHALYEAKAKGRNRVIKYENDD
jgi:polar amino acid transport system substrate-binding protein